jgi:hypothetical protein
MRNELQKQLANRYPTLKNYQITACVNSYVDAVMKEIAMRFATITSEDIEAGEFSFSADLVNKNSGQTSIDGTRMRVFSVMQSDPSTSLVISTYKGNSISKRVSKVTFNLKYKKDILNELIKSNYALTSEYLDELDEKSNFSVAVDMDALESYINNTTQLLAKAENTKYIEKLTRNLLASRRIKQRAVLQEDGSYLVKEYWTQIDSGRVHGHGLSLQLVAKEVRHAALGRCAKIDFKASSYAILTSLAITINPELKVEALKSYIKYRTPVRIRIAKAVGISVDWMKTIFTSLGFGAEVKDNTHNTIRKMLGQEKFNLLVANQEFACIKQELDLVRDTILKSDAFKVNDFIIGYNTYTNIDLKTGKKRTKNQKLAWIFQACERMALDIVIDKMPDNFTILLPVHDCIYIKQRLPAHVMLDLKDQLRQLFPLLDFDQELIIPIHSAEDHDKYNAAIDQEEIAHKQRIALEEFEARGHKSHFVVVDAAFPKQPDYSNETEAEYEVRRKQQFLRDIQEHEKSLELENHGERRKVSITPSLFVYIPEAFQNSQYMLD